MDLSTPRIMGIINITPDSFYAGSRKEDETAIRLRTEQLLSEGADIIDIGACSTRPGAAIVEEEVEMKRLKDALRIITETAPDTILSIDTYRANIAAMCVEEFGVSIVNDISAGSIDPQMSDTIARLNVPYVLTHMQGIPEHMQKSPRYENIQKDVLQFFAERIYSLRERGVNDLIIDPGFGFGKTLEQNYALVKHLEDFHLLNTPILVGFSRKSMIYNLLNTTAEEALNGTSVLNSIALSKGAHILRVHDVKACAEVIRIHQTLHQQP